jgi:hypothetical protein
MAMRRISWIDQRISGGVVMFWLLPGGVGLFFCLSQKTIKSFAISRSARRFELMRVRAAGRRMAQAARGLTL